jgi:hypothetical protein
MSRPRLDAIVGQNWNPDALPRNWSLSFEEQRLSRRNPPPIWLIASRQMLRISPSMNRAAGPGDGINSKFSTTSTSRAWARIAEASIERPDDAVHRPVPDALCWIRRLLDDRSRFIRLESGPAINDIIPTKWRDVVLESDGSGGWRIDFEQRMAA